MNDEPAVQEQTMLEEVLEGMGRQQKELPSKFFYDERGSRLFEKITRLEEYYPTRTEISILQEHINSIAKCIGERAVLIELGSGSSRKTRLLLDKLPEMSAYIPVDISKEYLQQVAEQLQEDYPKLLIHPVCADYTTGFELPEIERDYNRQVMFFPGSTIGNFKPARARRFINHLGSLLAEGDGLLIGVDLIKKRSVLQNAYNDKKGITAEFNKNILKRLNRELNADFDLTHFQHRAIFNERESRIEMHLVSEKEQVVQIYGRQFKLEKGETIHTENSYKYSIDSFRELVSDTFSVEHIWTDEQEYFSVQYLRKQ